MQNSTLFLFLGYSVPFLRIDFSVLCLHSHVIPLYTFTPFVQPFPLLVLWLLLTSDDSVVHHCTGSSSGIHQISRGKSAHFPLIYLPHLLIHLPRIFGTSVCLATLSRKINLMRFVFLRPRFCLRLPSDSASPRTPLSSASGSHILTPTVNFHHLVDKHARHTKRKTPRKIRGVLVSTYV